MNKASLHNNNAIYTEFLMALGKCSWYCSAEKESTGSHSSQCTGKLEDKQQSLSLWFWEEITDDTFPPILMLLSFKLSLINAHYFYHSEGPSSKINLFFPHDARKLKNLPRHVIIHSLCIVWKPHRHSGLCDYFPEAAAKLTQHLTKELFSR